MYIAVGEIILVEGAREGLGKEEGWGLYECVEEGIEIY